MKSTGIVRKVDELGRIVIPKELRSMLDIDTKDPLEIFIDGEKVILKKYHPAMACQVTGEVTSDNFTVADGKVALSPEGAKRLKDEIESYFVK
ncbi:AbrB/MazE/SpoVT family DNA-binding domain-containing protein [Tuberibacillus sp. Marseille-P3662]|uniref:AbrB/MazE/SpoVT family DNA-binding domain-containing protein n=1 Tax=Tuberibacillus sp. Marseille-P3662 TaxID=1965358 RepID=UPI000A1C9AE3|nr:AbrB/MazE/SpoVT family DNA-binding domain-containing protein [Tuberibacillus sp. Marseille-P3662]